MAILVKDMTKTYTKKMYILVVLLTITILLSTGFSYTALAQTGSENKTCEQCGMVVDSVSQKHLKVVDAKGTLHYVECLKCAFKLVPKLGELNVTTYCDWYGQNYAITISLADHLNVVIVNPSDAMFIDGNCMKNRVNYNQTAVDDLLANKGISVYLAAIQNVTIPSNSTVMTVAKAAAKYAFSPTLSSKTCEACMMNVTSAEQEKYKIVDENGTTHYCECLMCSMRLLSKYNKVNITTFCDWYGQNYQITITSSQYGRVITVSPSTTMYLSGGSCVTNRVAYNLTAADALKKYGFSSLYTVPEQHFVMPAQTTITSVKDAATTSVGNASDSSSQPPILLIVATVAGVALIVAALVAYIRMKRS
ncbi:MAG: hypothetical protein QG670_1606 [Thermoproteota archaeon]|nr:hypothetical protein [Thermoproteota archaeon]